MEFRRSGKAPLCVAHGLETLEVLCDRALWLEHGSVKRPARQVLQTYAQSSAGST
jgi:ABC-type polysaccharide/polyol phosphate transport system ATPase subunit